MARDCTEGHRRGINRASRWDGRGMRSPNPLPIALRGRPFLVSEAVSAGVPPGRLRRSDLARPFRGVRMPMDDADDLALRCRALIALLPPGAFFSHITAARLLGIPLPSTLERERRLHVSVVTPSTVPARRGVVSHEHLSAPPPMQWSGLPVSPPARAWATLASFLSEADLVAAGDYLVTGEAPWTTIAALEAEVGGLTGARGVRALRGALPQIRVGPRSRRETHARLLAVAAGLPEPELNVEIFDATGRFVAMVDLAWRARRVGLEYEGRHHQERGQFRKDVRRREMVEDIGWRLTRATADDLTFGVAAFVTRLGLRLGHPVSPAHIARAVALGRTFGS